MKRTHSAPRAAAICVACLLAGTAHAMEIQKFDKLAGDDRDAYTAEMVIGAERVLRQSGQHEAADKLHRLFTDMKPGDKASLGMAELFVNLAAVSAAEAKRQLRNPNLRHLEAEDAFRAVAQDHGITLPEAFNTVAAHFRPKHPPKP